jgi:gamma-aminobutyric acid type B receptor
MNHFFKSPFTRAFVQPSYSLLSFISLLSSIKVIEVMRHPHDKAESRFSTDTGISKEDEERYKKLVLENEELQKLIAQVRMTNDALYPQYGSN